MSNRKEQLAITAPTQKAAFSFRFDNLFFIFIFYFYDLNLGATALRVAAKRYGQGYLDPTSTEIE